MDNSTAYLYKEDMRESLFARLIGKSHIGHQAEHTVKAAGIADPPAHAERLGVLHHFHFTVGDKWVKEAGTM